VGQAEYERTLKSRCAAGCRVDGLEAILPLVIEGAAGALRRRLRAQEAWERIANPKWLRVAEVEAVKGGVVVVAVRGAAYYEEVRQQAGRLGRQLAELVPGMSRVRFVAAADGGLARAN
jgi:hypothetical protein